MESEIAGSGLTDKQERFAHEYLIDQNASAACLRAGYSAHSHAAQAQQLMRNAAVRRRVRALLEELYGQIKLDALRLIRERMATAFFDPRRLVDAQSRPRPVAQWDAESAAVMLVSFDVRADGEMVLRARQPSRAAALTALERRFAQFMKLQQEDTITERETADLHLRVGADPATLEPGAVVYLTPQGRERAARRAAEEEAGLVVAPVEAAPVDAASVEAPSVEPASVDAASVDAASVEAAPVEAAPVEAVPAMPAAPDPSLTQRALAALRLPWPAAAPAQPAGPAQPPRPGDGLTYRRAPPSKLKEDKYWCDLEGNINVDHPHCPPEVRARELEKRRVRAAQAGGPARAASTMPAPRAVSPQRQRYTDSNRDDPFD